jgi:hypothetical protein
MRKLFYQWAGVVILSLIGYGVDVMPQVTNWWPASIIWSVAFLWLIATISYWIKHRKTIGKAGKEITSNNLVDKLTNMHRQMIHLNNVRLSKSKKVDLTKSDDVGAILMDRLGLVELAKWDSFKKNIQRRIKKAVPKIRKDNWRFKVLSKASEIKKELCEAREWGVDDALIICEWLEEQHWGVRELRDKDETWNNLYESVKPYLVDDELRELIRKHITYSYIGCSVLLISAYSKKRQSSIFLALLHSVLIGSPIDPTEIDLELSRIIADIDKRTKILQQGEKE